MKLKIVTPEGPIYESAEVISVTIPTEVGTISVYDEHEPLMSLMVPGELNIEKADHTVDMVVSSGMLEIKRDSEVNMMVETAERVEEVDLQRAQEAHQRAEEYIEQQSDIDDVEFARLQAKLQKELARIDVATRYRRSRS